MVDPPKPPVLPKPLAPVVGEVLELAAGPCARKVVTTVVDEEDPTGTTAEVTTVVK